MRVISAVIVALLAIAAGIVVMEWLGYQADDRVVGTRIAGSINSGAATFPSAYNFDLNAGMDTNTDCVLLEIAAHIPRQFADALVSAPTTLGAGEHACDGVADRLVKPEVGPLVVDYWRYWWGSAYLLAAAVGSWDMSVATYRSVLKTGCYAAIVLITIVALVRYRFAAWPIVPLMVALTFAFGIPLFGGSISHGPELLVGLLLALIYMLLGIDRTPMAWNAAYAAFVGGMVGYFELLNGHLVAVMYTLAIACLCAARTFAIQPIKWPAWLGSWTITVRVIVLAAAFILGTVYTVILRCVLRAIVLGQSLSGVLKEWIVDLSNRTQNSVPDYGAVHFGPVYLAKRVYYKIEYGTYPYLDRTATIIVYAVCAVVFVACLGWMAFNFRKMTAEQRDPLVAVLAIMPAVPAWFLVLANHTAIHSWMTGRLVSLFFALALSLAILIVSGRPRRARA